MGLFSTLTSSTGNSNEGAETTPPTSSATIATVVQLYSNQQIILMEETPSVTGYSSLTYQAVQVGATRDDAVVAELKNRHSNPDLGVWNCRVVVGGNENSDPLVDSLLAKLASPSEIASAPSVYCLTVDLSDETTVEPNLSALQAALVRHLIEHPPQTKSDGSSSSNDKMKTIQTTSLYELQTVQFGLASDEKSAERTIDEASKEVKVGLMICAVVSSNDSNTIDESSEAAYKKKQARALVVYHLRKFATSINSALCFVERPKPKEQQDSKDPTADDGNKDVASSSDGAETASSGDVNNNVQLSISYDKLSQLWRDMATGVPVWEQEQSQPESGTAETSDVSPTALYGPGRQQEDLIESLLLRNANYPGHWDASKDSLWVALPASGEGSKTTSTGTSTAGDDGWLTQLRDSIASALPVTTDKADDKEKSSTPAEDGGKPKEKDAAVSSFFESLLKNP